MAGIVLAVVCVALLASASAFPDGAPSTVCSTLVPAHFPSTMTGPAPFAINVSAMSYLPGATVEGSLYSPTGQNLKGFLIIADTSNTPNSLTNPVGTFEVTDSTTQQNVCGQSGTQGITHKDNKNKTMVAFKWTAPSQSAGNVYFRATVVQGFSPSVFWLGIFSPMVKG